MDRPVRALLLLLACTLVNTPALAQRPVLHDPTVPPAAFLNPLETPPDVQGDLRLEAIRRGQGGATVAVINGELHRVGGDVAGRRILRIGEREVVLRGAAGRETLRMSPEVGKVKAGQ
ncbi:MAG: hypothetical protein PHT48_05740 [Dechloromonas sp.]|nr:hypothetical protein [Dechloromonas sp.]